jgi:hypothetical protein
MLQHTRKVVDQMQVCFCGLREWNLWMQQGQPLTSHTHLARVIDTPWDKVYTMWGEQPDGLTFFKMAIERAKQLGRNVAQAMSKPIEEAEYVGEESGVACPQCHCNILVVPENLPYVGCPICWIRGTVKSDKGQMKVEWNMDDLKLQRFSSEGLQHHLGSKDPYMIKRREEGKAEVAALKDSVFSQSKVKVITPEV